LQKTAHILRQNELNSLPSRIIFYDTESCQEKIDDSTTEHTFRLGWMCFVRIRRKGDIKFQEEWKSIRTKEEFWDEVEKRAYNKTRLYLIAHNQHFDFIVLDGFNELKKRGWELKKWIVDASLFILTFKKDKKTIIVLDSTNIFKFSIKSLGDTLGKKKLDIDFSTATDDELSVYCKRDVEILVETFKRWILFLREHELGNFKYTLASQAFTAFRHRFMHHDIYIHDNQGVISLERKAYRGGRTECFYIGEINNKVYDLDVNSLYPFVMREFEYPTKLIKHGNHLSIEGLKRFLSKYCVIAHVRVNTRENVFGIKKERLIFPIGRFDAYLCTEELKYALEHNMIEEIFEYALYEKEKLFVDYVDFFYELKEKYTREGNKVYRMLTKLFLNSLYGKFGQKNEKIELIGETDNNEIIVSDYIDIVHHRYGKLIQFNGQQYIKFKEYEEAFDSFVAIAAEITANARVHLWRLIQKAGKENVYYCDTDSLFVNEQGYNRLKDVIDNYRLGFLKLEAIGHRVIIRNVKDYIFDDTEKIKGVRKDSTKIGEYKYKTYRFLKFRTLLRKGKLDRVIVEEYIKTLKDDYKKGIVGKDGWVKPFELG